MCINETAVNETSTKASKPSSTLTGSSTNAREESDPALPQILQLTLQNLTSNLRATLSLIQGPLKSALDLALHDHNRLPDSNVLRLAAEAVDLLHETQKRLDPGPLILADHFLGYVSSKCLCAAVERGIPDLLVQGPKTLQQLAKASNARADRLGQVLRVLYNNGIFNYHTETHLYSNNHTSSLLRSDHWTQWRNWVELYGNQFYDIARGIPGSIHKDALRSAAQMHYDTDSDMFAYFQEQGWLPLLHRTLGGGAGAMAPGIIEDYPWTDLANETILDIGGGGGALIALLLRNNPTMRGGVYDLLSVIDHIKPFFHASGGRFEDVGGRVAPEHLIAGDFLISIPSFSVYTLKWCLHDWKDDEAIRILKNIRKAIVAGPKNRLIVMESILADGQSSRLSRYGDINMMMTANGQERTEEQWRDLAARSAWEIVGIHTLRNAWVKAMDFRPIDKGDTMEHNYVELNSLHDQHEWIKSSMGNLIHAPINPKRQGLRILDSGTADGYWLADVASGLPKTTTLIGTNTTSHLFDTNLNSSITLIKRPLTEPWPAGWASSFDLVHQRLALVNCDQPTSKTVISSLFQLVKPGGWIQLLEHDHSGGFGPDEHTIYPATTRFGQLVTNAATSTGHDGQHGRYIKQWLVDAGAVDVIETIMDCPVGAKATTPELKDMTTRHMLGILQNLKMAQTATPTLNLDEACFDRLHGELSEELSSKGSTRRFHLVYGRRPVRLGSVAKADGN